MESNAQPLQRAAPQAPATVQSASAVHPAAATKEAKEERGPDARLVVRSPLNPDVFVFMDIPVNIHPTELFQATEMARFALSIIYGKRKCIEYPRTPLGLFSLQVLAESSKKSDMSLEHRSRLVGMYGASQFVMSLEPFIQENRSISVSFLQQEAMELYNKYSTWMLHYSAEVLQSSAYPYDPERAARIGQKIEEVLATVMEEKHQAAERLAKAERIRKEERRRRAIQQEAAQIRKEEKEEEVRLQQDIDERAPVVQPPIESVPVDAPTSAPVSTPVAESPRAAIGSPVVAPVSASPVSAPATPAPANTPTESIVVVLEETPVVVAQPACEQRAPGPSLVVGEAAAATPEVAPIDEAAAPASTAVPVETSVEQETSS